MSPALIAIKSLLGLLVFWFFLFYLWRDYREDAFRDHVFSIRDRLFAFAARGGVSFDNPAYTILRFRMNVVLRYAHEFSLRNVLAVILLMPRPTRNPELARWEAAVKQLPSETARQELLAFNTTLAIAIAQLIIYRSFFLYLIIRPLMPFIETRKVFRKTPTLATQVEQLESEALDDYTEQRECAETVA